MKILRLMNCYNFFMVNGWRFVKIMLLQFMKIFKTFSLGLGSFLVLVEVKIETDMLIISDVFFPLYFPAVRKTAGQYTKPLTSKFTIFWTHVVCQLAVDCHIWPLVFFFFSPSCWICRQRKGLQVFSDALKHLEEVSWEVDPFG